ncbi:TPA: discoidin domain-containing protein, partial [Clostridium perfringens]|nr:discoidin domain-containing protein [Clostridium perfringens]
MNKKKISAILVASLTINTIVPNLSVLAKNTNINKIIQDSQKTQEINKVEVSKFETYYSKYKEAYDKEFKMDNSNIESITSTGGNLRANVGTANIIDGNLDTYWETGKHTSDSFKNELIFTLKEETVLNRIAYRSAWNTVGFAEDFEIWASDTAEGDDFNLIASATTSKTADVIEIKFNPTNFKRVKFVFKNAGTATASEMMFYKEDVAQDKLNGLFTDDTLTKVSEEFNSIQALNELEESIKEHPLYEKFKQSIEDAKVIVKNKQIEASKASMRKASYVENEEYNNLYRMSYDNIKSISNNGGHYWKQVIGNAIDGDLNSYWETSKGNTDAFKN